VAYGVLRSAAVGLRIGLVVTPPRFGALELFGGFWGPQTISGPSATGLELAPWYVGLGLCPVRVESPGHAALRLCLGGTLEVAQSSPRGFSSPHPATQVGTDVFLSGSVLIPIAGPVGLQIGGQVGPTLRREQYVYSDANGTTPLLFAEPGLHASAEAALAMRLP
jgi:hypothetical protein